MTSNDLNVLSLIQEGEKLKNKCLGDEGVFKCQDYYIWINKIEFYFRNSVYLNLPVYKKFLCIYESNDNSLDSYNQIYSILKAIESCEQNKKSKIHGLCTINLNRYQHWPIGKKNKKN